MWDFEPSWQNSIDCINRNPSHFQIIGVLIGSQLAGYGIIEPVTGDIPQLAVAPFHRRMGLGTAIFSALIKANTSANIKVINTDAQCIAATSFLERQGLPLKGWQYEMVLEL
jgi:GNAT superfamily N-acetyltransferase